MHKFAQVHAQLQQWYQAKGRKTLPWRLTADPYAIYLSEVMLQQTQVKTVLERYYFQFLQRFPTLQALAQANETQVLKAWEGLGYYTRARNLHAAAKLLVHQTDFPQTESELLSLPGIGKNTASAILAFAFKQPVPVMEANVKRILSRFFSLSSPTPIQLWEYANQLLDTQKPFDYNQAMMDIGALICTAKAPQCDVCPLASHCLGKNNPLAYPEKLAKKTVPIRQRYIIIWVDKQRQRYALIQRKTRFLGGLYGFMQYETVTDIESIATLHECGLVTQTYSHFKLDAMVYEAWIQKDKPLHESLHSCDWLSKEQLAYLPLSEVDKKIVKNFCYA